LGDVDFISGSYVLSFKNKQTNKKTTRLFKEEEENRLWGRQFMISAIDNQTHLG